MKANEKFTALNCKNTDPRVRRYLFPKRVVYKQGTVSGEEGLLLDKVNQILNLFGSEVGVVPMTKTDER